MINTLKRTENVNRVKLFTALINPYKKPGLNVDPLIYLNTQCIGYAPETFIFFPPSLPTKLTRKSILSVNACGFFPNPALRHAKTSL